MNISVDERERLAVERRRKNALLAEVDALRSDQKRRDWAAKGTYLTRAELEARVLCRGCGQPVIDDLGDWPPLMHMDDVTKRARGCRHCFQEQTFPPWGCTLAYAGVAYEPLHVLLPARDD